MKTYIFDLDNTLCKTEGNNYYHAIPIEERIRTVNQLYNDGNKIVIHTARGMTTCEGHVGKVYAMHYYQTKNQLQEWGVEYNELVLGKLSGDIWVDDRGINDKDFFEKYHNKKPLIIKGGIAGAYDIIHPGVIEAFKEAKLQCDRLIVFLHTDPSIERPQKLKPVLSVNDRINILKSIKYVDAVTTYETETQLESLMAHLELDCIFVGEDYSNKLDTITGAKLNIPINVLSRTHGWSTTKLKDKIYQQMIDYNA